MKKVFKRKITTYKYDAVIMNGDKTINHEDFYFSRKFKSEKAAIAAIRVKLPDNVRCLAADFVEATTTTRCMDLATFICYSYVDGELCVDPTGACAETICE